MAVRVDHLEAKGHFSDLHHHNPFCLPFLDLLHRRIHLLKIPSCLIHAEEEVFQLVVHLLVGGLIVLEGS